MPTSASSPPVELSPHTAAVRPRLDSIDLLRGFVMVIMALDHTREYFEFGETFPRDVHQPALFLTRWITHFCAPAFVFLAGMAAFLYGRRGRSDALVSRFLLTRGLWLIFLELTVVRFGWSFSVTPNFVLLQVIWVMGVSMVALSALIFLPRPLLGLFALTLIVGHNLLDGVKAEAWGQFRWLWVLLHQPGFLQPAAGIKVLAIYPLIPWLGVMMAGYFLGPIVLTDAPERRQLLLRTGTALILIFIGLRASGLYGDPAPWVHSDGFVASVLSFINCEKYPPSLLYLTMTLGPLLIALPFLDRAHGPIARFFTTFGRVPFFYYIAHIYLIHLIAVLVALAQSGNTSWLFQGLPPMARPPTWGFGLPAIYAWWILIVLLLYPLCRWFAALKQRRKDWWLSYV